MEPMDLDDEAVTEYARQFLHDGVRFGHDMTYRPTSPGARSDVSDMDVDSPLYSGSGQRSPTMSLIQESWLTSLTLTSPGLVSPSTQPGQADSQTPLGVRKPVNKPRLGLPEEETFFSHFPDHAEQTDGWGSVRSRTVCRQSRSGVGTGTKSAGGHSDADSTDTAHGARGKSSCMGTTCKLLVVMVTCAALLLAVHFLDVKKWQCKRMKQFSKDSLSTDLDSLVFGQHISTGLIPKLVDKFFVDLNQTDRDSLDEDTAESVSGCKPLVLAFYGGPGVGKNFVSSILAQHLPVCAVSYYIVPLHFAHHTQSDLHSRQVRKWVMGNLTGCAVNLLVFDEMDKASAGLVSGIVQLLGDLPHACSSPSIVLLLSNTHTTHINSVYMNILPGTHRQDINLAHFADLFSRSHPADSSPTPWYTEFRQGEGYDLIDAHIPFLPLERSHVRQCVQRELTARTVSFNDDLVDSVLHEMTFVSVRDLGLSTTGCKRVSDKIDLVLVDSD